MHSRSDRLFSTTLVGILFAVPMLLGTVRITGQVIVLEGESVSEDLYAFAERVVIDGTVLGDLFVVAGEVSISGSVHGDVVGLVGGPIRVSGEVHGSIRVAALTVDVSGIVDDDVATLAGQATIGGAVGRDLLAIAGSTRLVGSVGRDLRGQMYRMTVDGEVGRNVAIKADRVTVGPDTRVDGDLIYDSPREGRVDDAAEVTGTLLRREAITPVWSRAISRLIGALSLFGFILGGLVAAWLFRGVTKRSAETAATRPGKAALVGLALVVVPPLVALPLFLTLVGIPIALVILIAWVVMLFFGPVPAVTEVGRRLLRSRGGMAGGLVVGALLLRGVMWLLPLIAGIAYLAALVVGLGSYGMAAWGLRREHAAGS